MSVDSDSQDTGRYDILKLSAYLYSFTGSQLYTSNAQLYIVLIHFANPNAEASSLLLHRSQILLRKTIQKKLVAFVKVESSDTRSLSTDSLRSMSPKSGESSTFRRRVLLCIIALLVTAFGATSWWMHSKMSSLGNQEENIAAVGLSGIIASKSTECFKMQLKDARGRLLLTLEWSKFGEVGIALYLLTINRS